MKKSTQTVLYKPLDKKPIAATVQVIHHESWDEYLSAWRASKAPEVWYEKLGIYARAFTDTDNTIHMSFLGDEGTKTREKAVKLLGHEFLHRFNVEHPGNFVGDLVHVLQCDFGIASFSGLFRLRDNEKILPEAEKFILEMTRRR